MKVLNFTLVLLICSFSCFSQAQRPGNPDARANELKKIQAMEMAFITKELNLSPEEAQKFWPVFNQYRNELKTISAEKKINDHLEKQQKMLDIRKKYREDFSKVMNHDRANKVFGAEDEFKSLVRREFQKRQDEKRKMEPGKKGF
jgi:Spy/CpxP family protein refolding chaperone